MSKRDESWGGGGSETENVDLFNFIKKGKTGKDPFEQIVLRTVKIEGGFVEVMKVVLIFVFFEKYFLYLK